MSTGRARARAVCPGTPWPPTSASSRSCWTDRLWGTLGAQTDGIHGSATDDGRAARCTASSRTVPLELAWDGPASGPRGESLVLLRAQGGGIWPDGAAMPDPPAASAPPTNPAPEPTAGRRPASSCMADFVGPVVRPWRPCGMPRCPPSPGSKGRADRPARQQEGAHHDRGSRQLRRQPDRRA
jgi:hypothetical protein